jgi:hypothetical protein
MKPLTRTKNLNKNKENNLSKISLNSGEVKYFKFIEKTSLLEIRIESLEKIVTQCNILYE